MPDTLATTIKPDISRLLEEFRGAGANGDFWTRQQIADDTRLVRWDGQNDDGKKHDSNLPEGQRAFPWDGASDVRCYQSDEVINENVATKLTAFWRSSLRVEGIETGDLASASSTSTFMDWMRNSDLRDNLEDDVELSAQYEEWYGWTALHVTWERQLSYKWRVIDLEALTGLAQKFQSADQLPPEAADIAAHIMAFPQLVMDPEQQELAVDSTKFLYRVYVNQTLPQGLSEEDIPELSDVRATQVVRELRESGRSQIPFPYLCKNKPCITALKPWRDIVVPTDTTDLQSARAIFIRQFYSEAELRSMAKSDGWDQGFIDAAVETKGRLSVWSFSNQGLLNPLWQWSFTSQRNNLIEILVAYHKAIDEDGLSAVYYSILSAHLTQDNRGEPLIAKSGMLEHPNVDDYPIVLSRREVLDRQVMSARGVPEILLTSQREEKVIRDAVMDWCSIGVVPPLNVYKGTMGQRYKFAPAAENQVTAGREPKLMEIHSEGPQFAIEYLAAVRSSVDHYFGRVREDVSPQLAQVLLEPRIRRFLSAWGRALKMAFCLYQKYAPDTFERVSGQPSPGEDAGKLDFIFHFDIAQLNPEMMEAKLRGFSQLLPEDSAGVIDRAALIRAKARMIDPNLARELVMEQGAASQQLYDKVKNDLISMSDGNEASYTDAANDPTAQARGQYLQQLISNNLKYLQRIDPELLRQIGVQMPEQMQGQQQGQVDAIFTALLGKYLKNLQLGISQVQNKQIGRIGVAQ